MDNTADTNAPEVDSQTPAVAVETPEQPRKRNIIKIILIVIGVLILLGVIIIASLVFYLQSKGLTADKISPKAVPTSTMTRNDNKTNNYKNNAYKFTMPYANDLKISEKPYGFGVTSVEMRAEDTTAEYGPDFRLLIFPKAIGEQIGQDFNKYYSMNENSTQEIKDPSGTTVSFTKLKTRTVNGNRAFDFTSKEVPAEPDVESEIGVYIEMGNDIMVISTAESNKAELETMLKDFKYPQQ